LLAGRAETATSDEMPLMTTTRIAFKVQINFQRAHQPSLMAIRAGWLELFSPLAAPASAVCIVPMETGIFGVLDVANRNRSLPALAYLVGRIAGPHPYEIAWYCPHEDIWRYYAGARRDGILKDIEELLQPFTALGLTP